MVSGAGALADAVDTSLLREEFMGRCPRIELSELSASEMALLESLFKFQDAIDLNFQMNYRRAIHVKDLPNSIMEVVPKIMEGVWVIARSHLLDVDGVGLVVMSLIQKYRFGPRILQSKLTMQFVRDPLAFRPSLVSTAVEPEPPLPPPARNGKADPAVDPAPAAAAALPSQGCRMSCVRWMSNVADINAAPNVIVLCLVLLLTVDNRCWCRRGRLEHKC